MSTPQEVVRSAADLVRGSRIERARAGMTTLNLFSQLSADDKRDLAVMVAQKVAPQLVPRIQAESGLDMTPEQSRAVLDMVRRLDGDDLAEIQAALGSSEARRATAQGVATAAARATGVDDVIAPPAQTTDAAAVDPADADRTSERDQARIRVLEERIDELTEQVAEARRTTTEAEGRARTAEGELHAASARADDAERRSQDLSDELDDARDQVRQAQGRTRTVEAGARVSTAQRPVPGGSGTTRSVASAAGPVGLDAATLAARMESLSTSAALRTLVGAASALRTLSPAERHHLVTRLPDGWARRRAVQRLVEAEVILAPEAPRLLATLTSTGNQVFAAGTMIDTGMVHLDDLVDALEPQALARLARRTPAPG